MKVPSLITLLLLALMMVARADDKPKSKSKAPPKEQGEGEVAKVDSGLSSLGSLIPEGVKNAKVKIPSFDRGRLSSLITADTMTRVSPNELFAEGLVIHLYGRTAMDNMRVDMKSATYHMDTKMLISKERSKVSRADFTIEGDSAVYDTATGTGVMKGRVHTVIYDSDKLVSKEDSQPAAASAVAPPNANP